MRRAPAAEKRYYDVASLVIYVPGDRTSEVRPSGDRSECRWQRAAPRLLHRGATEDGERNEIVRFQLRGPIRQRPIRHGTHPRRTTTPTVRLPRSGLGFLPDR